MAFVVCEPCVKCKFTDCVAVCPVDAFHEATEFLVIDPDVCIDCGACVPECPAEAIYDLDDVPEHWQQYVQMNADMAPSLPEITEQQDSLPDAEDWKTPGQGKWGKIGDKDQYAKA